VSASALAQHRVGSGGRFACLPGFFLPLSRSFFAVAKYKFQSFISNLRFPGRLSSFILPFLASFYLVSAHFWFRITACCFPVLENLAALFFSSSMICVFSSSDK